MSYTRAFFHIPFSQSLMIFTFSMGRSGFAVWS